MSFGFTSDWYVDNLTLTNSYTQSVATGTNTYTVASHGLGYYPKVIVQYKVGSYWAEPGTYTFAAKSSPLYDDLDEVDCHIEIDTGKIEIVFENDSGVAKNVEIRYWIYANDFKEDIDG